jgi:hypothetical protein
MLLKEGKPVKLPDVDNAMRDHFGAPPDAENWYCNWVNSIGLLFALGHGFDQIRASFDDDDTESRDIVDWIQANYNVDCWYQSKLGQ